MPDMSHTLTAMWYCTTPADVPAATLRYLRRHHLLKGVSRLGLAVSGGADSVALFHLLLPVCQEADIALTVLHLNHGLRAEAEAEAAFVCELACGAGLPMLSETIPVAKSMRGGASLEMVAREVRMAFFMRCVATARLDAIATGHQADDVAESVLLRLARGAGASGLSGLSPRSLPDSSLGTEFTLIRPLLAISGAALRAWLRQYGYAWREDSSNSDVTIPRNYVRNTLLPQLEQNWVPGLRPSLCQSAEILREDDQLLESLARQCSSQICSPETVAVAELMRQPEALQRRILRQWLFLQKLPEAVGLKSVLSLLDRCHDAGDWKHQLPDNTFAVCHAGLLRFVRPAEETTPPEEALVPLNGTLRWGTLEIETETGCGASLGTGVLGVYPAVCTLSLARLEGRRLCVRSRHPGDRIAPTGMDGSKKFQDLFVDAKLPESLRDTTPLFVCDSEVVWVPGYRISRYFAAASPDAPSLQISVRQTSVTT